jgi:hypothetical protein
MDVVGAERGGGEVEVPSCTVHDGRDGQPSGSYRKAADLDVESG